MTILQLKYVIAIANSRSMRGAASGLFISQPALSASIKELEEELNIQIFDRTNKGISLTKEGEDFLTYAKQAVSQYSLIEDRYLDKNKDKIHFNVSIQHYIFAVHAFINTIKSVDASKYIYSLSETKTDDVLLNVGKLNSEVGVISYTKSNERLIKKLFREYGLEFNELLKRDTYAYMWKEHPLAKKELVSLEDLKDYPCVSFNQNSDKAFYLPEEALSNYNQDKRIEVNDRASSVEFMQALNGYSIGTGIMIDSKALKEGFVSVKLKEEDPLTIGYIVRKNNSLSDIAKLYIGELLKYKEIV
ncbi:LysR family transcriptional regulator [Lachnospira pectinoschiza]|uniref:DNA-binding transcriptional regulator, LysR family n=1 Tax=Lachnospira pectinoschiza TaxID=28052 RepID=A0A1G9T525_9FIRM|nr:LysR family transcriptional regulator [Lachnospira pectinoschiza]SDM42728.1 DNA-binding transcriptional regulator, LysR family [Lachnospira pectinoschiza]